ncbi:hypothetical protein D3C81_1813470 [compost metagenome]
MRSSCPAEYSLLSSHSHWALIVNRSSSVIASLNAPGCAGVRSGKKPSTGALTLEIMPRSMAAPTSMAVTLLVRERVLCRVVRSAPLK